MKVRNGSLISLCPTCHQYKSASESGPYWRSGGAIFHLEDSLHELEWLLRDLIVVHASADAELEDQDNGHPDETPDNPKHVKEFDKITAELRALEHRIKLKAEIASLMSAIETEEEINQFCYFNLHSEVAESIEKLSPAEKLLVAAGAIGKPGIKQTAVFEAVRRLSTWRNAFTHGHCVDRPTKSLKHNHIIHPGPDYYPGVPSVLAEMRAHVLAFLRVSDFLRNLSHHPYSQSRNINVENVRRFLSGVSKYRFKGNTYVYDITLSTDEQEKVVRLLADLVKSRDRRKTTALESALYALDPLGARILRLELGLENGDSRSHSEIEKMLKISARGLGKSRALALTRLSQLKFLRNQKSQCAFSS